MIAKGWGACAPCLSYGTITESPTDTAPMATATTAFIPTATDRDTLAASLKATFPVSSVNRSTLGGEQNASLIVKVSLDPKEEWINGIFHNSRYAMFSVGGGKIEMFSYNKTAKFRKANASSVEEAISRLRVWKAKNEG